MPDHRLSRLGSDSSSGHHPGRTGFYVHLTGRAATAASLFFLFGQGGLSLGPAIGGLIVDHLDRPGVLLVTVLAAPVGILAARVL